MFWEERSKLLRTWVENNEDSGLVEAAVHYSKENEHELEGGKDLMTVADMIKAGFSTLLGQHVTSETIQWTAKSFWTLKPIAFGFTSKEKGGKYYTPRGRDQGSRCPRWPWICGFLGDSKSKIQWQGQSETIPTSPYEWACHGRVHQ